ncbi:MAG: fumarate hydratase, partial [Euryarchaeota archaeon]|nr:fumarate hydratase [Euryarchaeota archaeon]
MNIPNLIKNAVIEASTTFRKDQFDAYKRALSMETNENAAWILELLIENAKIANKNKLPLCDDTGIPHVIVE